MYRETTEDKVEIIIAESVRELAQAVEVANREHPYPLTSELDREYFYGRPFRTWDDVTAATAEPWPEGLAIVERMLAQIGEAKMPKPVSRRRKTRFSEDGGDEVDYDRLRDGRAFWRSSPRANASGPATITIVADMRAACSVDHRDILWRGAAAVALTYLMEQAGYRVELWAAQAEAQAFENGDMFVAVCLKRPGDPVDLGSLIAGVSAWFYRTIGFNAANLVKNRVPTSFAGLDRAGGVNPFIDRLNSDENKIVVEKVWDFNAACELVRGTVDQLVTRAE